MAKLHTLTVPDMLWINLQITGSPQKYDFATLEEGTFYQYKNGRNNELSSQAARFLTGFHRLAPFAEGNAATAFVGCLAFLEMNGKLLNLVDKAANAWVQKLLTEPSKATEMISDLLDDHEVHSDPNDTGPQLIVNGILSRFTETLASLGKNLAKF